MKKRMLSSVLLALVLTSVLAGCGNQMTPSRIII